MHLKSISKAKILKLYVWTTQDSQAEIPLRTIKSDWILNILSGKIFMVNFDQSKLVTIGVEK